MSAASNDNEQGSDLDEPMASQSQVSQYEVSKAYLVLKSLHFMRSQNKTVSLAKFKTFHVAPRQYSTQAIASSIH